MKKIKKFAKNLFSANRMKMLAMMLLCGTAVPLRRTQQVTTPQEPMPSPPLRRRLRSMFLM